MEPKLVKEEISDKDTGNYIDTSTAMRTRSSKVTPKERCKTPDSPEGARVIPPSSPTQSSPHRNSGNGAVSPVNNGSADSLTPPLPASALSVNLDTTPAQQYNHSYASCITRPLIKVKRFLSTLVQFGNDISSDIGERVRSLVLNLVSSNLSIEEFHHSLQDVTNFPLRPFVLPFLRAHLPLLQREIHGLARTNKQSPLQYVRSHEHVILDPAHSPSEPSEIFLSSETQMTAAGTGVKRRASDSIYENGINGQMHSEAQEYTPIKRQATQNAFLFSHQSLLLPNMNPAIPNSHFFDYSQHSHNYAAQHRPEDVADSKVPNRGDEEWRNIHVMLNCILSMVEKTKRALTILQQRNNQDMTNEWFRKQDVSVDLKKAANEIMMQAVKQTEDRVAEVKRRAEEAVNDVKRQAVIELQKAVTAAETKANELITAERAKTEKLLLEARKHTDDNSGNHQESNENLSPPNVPQPSQQNSCWNCGRKAHETCSGCNIARYCGPFCQHKDWENHHQICNKEKNRPIRSSTPSTTALPTHQSNPPETTKFKK